MAWALVNKTTQQSSGADPSTTMTITIPATTAGNLIVVAFFNGVTNGDFPLNSITGSAETWEDPGKSLWNANSILIDAWYTRNAVGGDTSYTLNYTSSAGGVQWATVSEFSYSHTNGSCIFEDCQSRTDNSAAANLPGMALTLTGASDVICQTQEANSDQSGIDSGYVYNDVRFGFADAYLLNTASGAAPTWTSGASGQISVYLGIAFKEAIAGAAAQFVPAARHLPTPVWRVG